MGAVRISHSIRKFATQPAILWILLGGKPKWLPLNFGFNDVMRKAPIPSRSIMSTMLPHEKYTRPRILTGRGAVDLNVNEVFGFSVGLG